MARKKKRGQRQASRQPDRAEPFQAPFGELKTWLRHTKGTPAVTASEPKPTEPPDTQAQREQALFLAEMAGVKPLPPDPRGRVETPRPGHNKARQTASASSVMAALRERVDALGTFTIQYTEAYMEGVAPNLDLQLTQRLHRGDFAIQAHLDLHGFTVDEAKAAVDRFLHDAYARGRRCVRLVHGRGRHSRDNRPVLKEQVQFWLSHGHLSRLVLAFATAPTADGGAGAVYVLLRRGPHAWRRT